MKALLVLLFAAGCSFCNIDHDAGSAFMPENDLWMEDTLEGEYDITPQDFEERMDEARKIYEAVVKKHGGELKIVGNWQSPTVNAYFSRSGDGKVWKVQMFGGLARRISSADGFSGVVCHEVMHGLGGWPHYSRQAFQASVEGQSDYAATSSCLRKLWQDQKEQNAEAAKGMPKFPKDRCDAVWKSKEDKHLCYRIALAGKSLADLLGELNGQKPAWESPQLPPVRVTEEGHPGAQCRLNTYLAGALCGNNLVLDKIPQNEQESAVVSCLRSRQEFGARPECWFKAKI